jgi:hypothetical protein
MKTEVIILNRDKKNPRDFDGFEFCMKALDKSQDVAKYANHLLIKDDHVYATNGHLAHAYKYEYEYEPGCYWVASKTRYKIILIQSENPISFPDMSILWNLEKYEKVREVYLSPYGMHKYGAISKVIRDLDASITINFNLLENIEGLFSLWLKKSDITAPLLFMNEEKQIALMPMRY